jgi:glycerophosphoryl diester phosphodiesterase family protein
MPGRFPPPHDAGPNEPSVGEAPRSSRPPSPGTPGGPPAWSPPPESQPGQGWGPPPSYSGWQPQPPGFFPLDIGRVFSLTFSLFRFRWKTLIALSLLIELPATVLGVVGGLVFTPDPSFYTGFGRVPTQAQLSAMFSALVPILLVSLVLGLIAAFVSYIGLGALIDSIARVYAGSPVSAWASFRRAWSRWVTFVAAQLLMFLGFVAVFLVGILVITLITLVGVLLQSSGFAVFLVLIAYVGMIAALIFVGVRWSMAAQVVMLESLGARAALRRSWHLVAGSGWRVIGYYLAFGLIIIVIGLVFGAVLGLLFNPYQMDGFTIVGVDWPRLAIFSVAGSLVSAVLLPITTISATLLYMDLRFRHGERINAPGQGSIVEGSVPEQEVQPSP